MATVTTHMISQATPTVVSDRLTVAEAGGVLDYDPDFIETLIRNGVLKVVQDDAGRLVTADSVEDYRYRRALTDEMAARDQELGLY